MRIAFADLLFSWPPNGGADADCFHVIQGLQARGHEVHLFVAHEIGSTDRGRVEPATLPFPATRLDFTIRSLLPENVAARFRAVIDEGRPDLVFLMHGYALKPYLALALAHHRTVMRFYAHEFTCARNALRFKDDAPCPNDFLRTPEICRRCALESQRAAIQQQRRMTWTTDYLAARAYAPEYHALALRALRSARTVIVSNPDLRADLDGFHDDVRIVPGGVDIAGIPGTPVPARAAHDAKIILMTGRADDPLKGLSVLLEAGEKLRGHRADFEVWATHFEHALSNDWFKAIGWRDHAGALALYADADICVVPSVWEEPFGLTAVEAMAAGRPVCASRVGGLRGIVRDGDTGFLFERGDAAGLAAALERLLDDAGLRAAMGARGRIVAEAEYDWDTIIERHYEPLLRERQPHE